MCKMLLTKTMFIRKARNSDALFSFDGPLRMLLNSAPNRKSRINTASNIVVEMGRRKGRIGGLFCSAKVIE